MVETKHPNGEVDIEVQLRELADIEDSPIQKKLNDIIEGLENSIETTDSIHELIDVKDEFDGSITKLMRVYYKHLNPLLNEKVIDKITYGSAVINLLERATATALDASKFDRNLLQTNAEAIAKIASSKVDLAIGEMKKYISAYEVQDLEYKTKVFNPLTRESMKEDIENKHSAHKISEYELSNVKPKEVEALNEKILSSTLERTIKTYYNQNVQPKELDKLTAELGLSQYELSTVKPKEVEALGEKILASSRERTIRKYYNENIQPKELDKLTSEVGLSQYELSTVKPKELEALEEKILASTRERTIRKYYNENIQPKELARLTSEVGLSQYELSTVKPKEIELLNEKKLSSALERTVKSYYNQYIQPAEKELTEAKARIESYNAGFVGSTNLPTLKHAQIQKQTELYQAEITNYTVRRRQELLKTIVNYHSMIFPDLPAPTALNWASNESNSNSLYALLK